MRIEDLKRWLRDHTDMYTRDVVVNRVFMDELVELLEKLEGKKDEPVIEFRRRP